jgi:hypothetical protein
VASGRPSVLPFRMRGPAALGEPDDQSGKAAGVRLPRRLCDSLIAAWRWPVFA